MNVEVGKYAEWVEKVQHMPDANVDVRVEPKFEIPSGKPYEGGWCRPQTDGPGLNLTRHYNQFHRSLISVTLLIQEKGISKMEILV